MSSRPQGTRRGPWARAAAIAVLVTVVAVVAAAGAPPAGAVAPSSGIRADTVASGLVDPTALVIAPDGAVYVAQQGGAVRVVRNGVLSPTPVLTVPVDATGERGLIGITLHPSWPSVPRLYVHYTVPSGGGGRAARRRPRVPSRAT
jgi:glucose/arabinose dehydrogenase